MRLDDQRRSTNVEVRSGGGGGGGGGFGGLPVGVRGLGLGGIILIGLLLFIVPANVRNMVLGQITGGSVGGSSNADVTQGCQPNGPMAQACDFGAAVLGSTEDVWTQQFQQGRLPNYGRNPGAYEPPKLVLYDAESVESGCGNASADVGPFYCPNDRQLYLNPSFYDVMRTRLNASGDFAQAYVIAHEVGHHVQNLIGATELQMGDRNQTSVRLELQADCFAGVWGRASQAAIQIDEADLREALNAAHQIGDDTLQTNARGYPDPSSYTHGTSEQRMRWFRRGFDSGDARQCDTFGVRDYNQL